MPNSRLFLLQIAVFVGVSHAAASLFRPIGDRRTLPIRIDRAQLENRNSYFDTDIFLDYGIH
jgi:hypothetical protein